MIKNILAIAGLSLLMSCQESPEAYVDHKEINESTTTYKEHEDFIGVKIGDVSGNASPAALLDENLNPPGTAEPPPAPTTVTQTVMSNQTAKAHAINKAQKIIKSGNITVKVEALQAAKSALDLKIKSLNGYYESENFHDGSYTSEYHLSVRVPADGFDELVSGLDVGFGKILFKTIHAKDVTEEYVDLGIRLESKLVALASYRKFLKRATNVEEILDVQREIRKIEEEIEAKKGRLRYLDDQLDYSTLRIDLVEHRTIIAKSESRHFGQQIRGAFISGYDGILNFVIAMAYVWPLWIVLGIIVFVWSPKLKGVFERRSQ